MAESDKLNIDSVINRLLEGTSIYLYLTEIRTLESFYIPGFALFSTWI
jgi:hypothetical protein